MNPAETIQAAIDKLDGLRQKLVTSDGFWAGKLADDADAELVVTLHRTIDAQLTILRTERGIAKALGDRYGDTEGTTDKAIVDLARAILGAD